jgi:allophanate hydrolase subunit 2
MSGKNDVPLNGFIEVAAKDGTLWVRASDVLAVQELDEGSRCLLCLRGWGSVEVSNSIRWIAQQLRSQR